MPYQSQYDFMLQMANSFQLYTAADSSFDVDAFDAAFQESLTWAQQQFNPTSRPAPTWQDFVRYKAEASHWQRLFGPGSKLAQPYPKFLGQAAPDPRPPQPPQHQADMEHLAGECRLRQQVETEPFSRQTQGEERDGLSSTSLASNPRGDSQHLQRTPEVLGYSSRVARSPIPTTRGARYLNRASSPTSRLQRRSRSPTQPAPRPGSMHSPTLPLTRSRSPLPAHGALRSTSRRSPSNAARQPRRMGSNSMLQPGRTRYDEPAEKRTKEQHTTPSSDRTSTRSAGDWRSGAGEVDRIPVATGSDPATRSLDPFFALHPNGQPRFGAVSCHRNAYRAFVGLDGAYIRVLEAKFPMLRIRCARVAGGITYFWAEIRPRGGQSADSKYFSLSQVLLSSLQEAEILLKTWAALPSLPSIDDFVRDYNNGKYQDPTNMSRGSTAQSVQPPAARLQQRRGRESRINDSGVIKHEEGGEE